MVNTSEYLYQNEKLPDKSILKSIKECNARETISMDGWPRTFSPTLDHCPQCKVFLSPVTKKRRRSSEDMSLLVSLDHILEVDILTKQCKLCFLIVKPDTLCLGLFNVGDILLVSVDILFSLQNMIRLVNFVEILVLNLCSVILGEDYLPKLPHHPSLPIFSIELLTSLILTGNIIKF